MKGIVTKELVYFTGKTEKKRDFSGAESAFCETERIEFLKQYQKEARKWYQDAQLNQKAVLEEDVERYLRNIAKHNETKIRKTIFFDTMVACEAKKEPEYKGLHLYCGAKCEGNEIVFPEKAIRPTPCALYEIPASSKIKISFDVFISSSYKCTQNEKCGEAQAGRVIELRSGTLDVVKIKLCNSGEIFSMSKDMWVPEYTYLGNVLFGEWNTFTVEVGEKVSITANGEKFDGIKPTCEKQVDSIFFDGGMFPRCEWRIANLAIDKEKIVFCKNDVCQEEMSEERVVELPYAIGTYPKRDRRIYLTKKFEVDDYKEALLYIETLDPCGKAWINGELVLDTDTFTENIICVSKYLKKGENELKIMVEPRAPEVYYFWHRHTDCYNGWFCGKVALHLTNEIFITDVQVRTQKITLEVSASATVELNAGFGGRIKLYAKKCYPTEGEEIFLGEKECIGCKTQLDFAAPLEIWNTELPNLYAVRVVLCDAEGREVDDFVVETGFRTIEQRDGAVFLNGKRILLNGALQMQFMPPFDEVPVNHNCPSDFQIAWQAMMLKAMNGNIMRLHILGYGTNEVRYAEICDRMGLMLVWTTRFIDTLEELVWDDGYWHEKEKYIEQIKAVANHPSIIMYEGSNEYHSKDLATLDRMYDNFVDAVKSFDTSRLLSPVSHLYYGGGIYEMGCSYYLEDGMHDQNGAFVESGNGWRDEAVVRSAHTYTLLCGYGESWEAMRKQEWKWQEELLKSKKHSYLITEYAVTALPNPNTNEALINDHVESYERPDEIGAIGRMFEQSEWRESQALQALCASQGVKLMRKLGVDGMMWCCLMSGANNGSYMKPPIDFYGYKKLAFYALRDAYRSIYATKEDIDLAYGSEDSILPLILNCTDGGEYDLIISVFNEKDELLDSKSYLSVNIGNENMVLEKFRPNWKEPGYYTLKFELIPRGDCV